MRCTVHRFARSQDASARATPSEPLLASLLQLEDEASDSNTKADLVALRCLVFKTGIASQDAAGRLYDGQVVLYDSFNIASATARAQVLGCATCRFATSPKPVPKCSSANGIASGRAVKALLASQHTGRAAAISMDPSPLDKAKRSSWCLLITFLTMQFCNKRNLGDLLTADKLCVYKVVKSLARDALHNYGQRLSHRQATVAGLAAAEGRVHAGQVVLRQGDRVRLTVPVTAS